MSLSFFLWPGKRGGGEDDKSPTLSGWATAATSATSTTSTTSTRQTTDDVDDIHDDDYDDNEDDGDQESRIAVLQFRRRRLPLLS